MSNSTSSTYYGESFNYLVYDEKPIDYSFLIYYGDSSDFFIYYVEFTDCLGYDC